ncbi:MarR family winged helix-turn-helix transcriptional regulator [Umezawaea endophytica]|uniref:MarR family winged helix-turn-helix transcriptional regulator n=1 Tax=Umezawaea endophytica TaxID=1654476 RepID=A0A9X3AF98_9PSEU|nr:MarR family winged helix-turn-helix transcriptional regulator [Umezawaea endophytica]MCS7476925.1 MarR family winged helix-turn-helix transcriptional regulator [Umezawaea endophytica]
MESESGPPLSAAFLAMALGRRVRERVEDRLREHGIALRHLSALGHLHRRPGISYSELARRAGVTPQSMQDTLRRLEQLGAVERTTEPGRGRTAMLRVTDEGHRLRLAGRAVIDETDAAITGAGPDDHLTQSLRAALDRFPLEPERGAGE